MSCIPKFGKVWFKIKAIITKCDNKLTLIHTFVIDIHNVGFSLVYGFVYLTHFVPPQPAITCSKLTTEILEQGVKYVQNYQ